MVYKSLILGILFSIGIFAMKSGIGFFYVLGHQNGLLRKMAATVSFAAVYGLVFGLTMLILHRFDPMRHLQAFQTFLQSGMMVHIVMAGMMIIWGIVLLKHTGPGEETTKGWLLLVVPCPVCATVIFLSSAFLNSLFPDHFIPVLLGFYAAFMALSMMTAGVIRTYLKTTDQNPETILGGAMLLIAAWFLISVTVMPQFVDLDRIYRLAVYKEPGAWTENVGEVMWPAILAVSAFLLGYGFTVRKIRRSL